jgi:hypothetical protein
LNEPEDFMEQLRHGKLDLLRTAKPQLYNRKLLAPLFLPNEVQPLKAAPFVQELIRELQAQLHQLERSNDKEPMPARLLDAGYRRRRYEIFRWGLQRFGDAFSSHRLLIDAIAEEHDAYVRFLQDHSERVVKEKRDFTAWLEAARKRLLDDRRQWECEHSELVQALRHDRSELEASKQIHLECMTREKAALPDANRKVQDLQTRLGFLQKDNETLTAEVGRLNRLNASLSVETFSDALLATMEELRETKSSLAEKEELLVDSVDAVEDLSRDLQKLCEAFVRELRRPPTKTDVRLTQRGLNVLKSLVAE